MAATRSRPVDTGTAGVPAFEEVVCKVLAIDLISMVWTIRKNG